MSSEDLSKMLLDSRKQVFVIDIRIPSEYTKGHIPTAINIYETDLTEENLSKNNIQKNSKIVIYCNTGLHSAKFCELLTNFGYKDINNLIGGFKGWSYPIEK